MTTAIVTLGTKDNREGCQPLMDSLEKHSPPPSTVDKLVLCDFDDPPVDFAVSVPVTVDYSDLLLDDKDAAKKFFMFLLPYNQVIYLDSKLMCTGDLSVLWSEQLNQHLLYAKHLPDGGIDDRVMVFNHDRQLGFHDAFLYLARVHMFDGYGKTSRDMLNGYFCHTKRKVGNLQGLNIR